MKKKLLALAALFSTAAVCVGVGVGALHKDATIVNAADPVTTWTDTKGTDDTADDVTYTFDYDISTGYYTDLGDLNAYAEISTETGRKFTNIPQGGDPDIYRDENLDGAFVMANAGGILTNTGGIAFQMKTDNVWVRPAGTSTHVKDGALGVSNWARVDIFYGDSRIYLTRKGSSNDLQVEYWHHNGTSYVTGLDGSTNPIAVIPNFFVDGAMTDWAEIKLSKIQCTAISNSSTATGYWMNFSIKAPGASEATPVINQYFNHEGQYGWNKQDTITIKNCTVLEAANADYDIDANTEGVQRYVNHMYLRRADGNYIDEATYYQDEVSYDASYWANAYGRLGIDEMVKLANGNRTVTSSGELGGLGAGTGFYKKAVQAYHIAGSGEDANTVVKKSNGISAKVAPADGAALSGERWDFLGGMISGIRYSFTYTTSGDLLLTIEQNNTYDGNKYAWDVGSGMGTVRTRYILSNNFDTSAAHTYEVTRRLVNGDETAGLEKGYLLSFYIDRGTANEIVLKVNSGFAAESRYHCMSMVANFGKDVIAGDVYSNYGEETYTDLGELNDNIAYGVTNTSGARWDYEPNSAKVKAVANTDGFEVRFKGVSQNALLAAPTASALGFLRAEVGTASALFDLRKSGDNYVVVFDTWNTSIAHTNMGLYWTGIVYEDGAEYVVRMTRTAFNYQGTMAGQGSIIRVYMAKVDAATGAPADGWDAAPVAQWLDKGAYVNGSGYKAGNESLCLAPTNTGNSAANAHDVYFSSNKYVGVKTIVDGTPTVNKVVRGEDFTLPTVDNLVAWSGETVVKAGATLADVNESATYTAQTLTISDSAYSALRFRPIDKAADLTADNIQVSIKWTATVNRADVENIAEALGASYEIGYVVTKHGATDAEDMKSPETAVENFAGNTFAVLQSGITEADYNTEFSMQSYVKFTLEDDSTVYVWGEVNEDGYTKNNTTVAHIVNGAWATATDEQSEEYCYEVETGVYSCYDTTLYTVLKNYYNLINA